MLTGILLGWLCGLILKREQRVLCHPGRRAAFWTGACLVCLASMFVTLSTLHARPLSPPLSWLKDVVLGYESEFFFGASIYSWNPHEGALSGGGWIFFNALDLVLLFFTGLIAIGVTADRTRDKKAPPDSRRFRPGRGGNERSSFKKEKNR